MRFAQPLWLIALAAIPISIWIHRRGIGVVSAKQRAVALWIRIAILSSIALALAGTSLTIPDPTLATVFVLDRSDSVGGDGLEESEAFVRSAIRQKDSRDLAGVIAAGREGRVEISVQSGPELIDVASQPDTTRTDLARSLRLAAAILPEGTRRRIVLLSDGRENSGDAREEVRRLRRQGIRMDAVVLASSRGPDAAVVAVDSPARARVGDEIELSISVHAATSMPGAQLVIRRGSQVLSERRLDLARGENEVTLVTQAGEPGAVTFSATIAHDRDSVPQNDSSSAVTIIAGPPNVILIEGEPGEAEYVAKALADRGIRVETRPPSGFPSATELAAIDSLVLVDVSAGSFTRVQEELMKGFVQDLGRGLVAIGGESSWSLGDYRGSILEELLPVSSEIKDPERRPSVAQVLVVDSSGSMSEGNKLGIGKAGALLAAQALDKEDQLGILAFTTTSRWVLDLQPLVDREKVRSALEPLQPNGGTEIPQAINTAAGTLEKSDAALKHIILFSDGFNGSGDMLAAAKEARSKGITLSVIGTGESAADVLEAIATEGGGRFYPGRDLSQIPQILHDETILASRRYVNEGVFLPKVTGSSPSTDQLTESPPLLGYIGTSAKTAASTLLSIGEFDDPLLATWRTGLGVASAWTSDAKARWSSEWIRWDGFADFWSSVVRETLPANSAPGYSLRTSISDAGIEVIVESETTLPEGTAGTSKVIDPLGRTHTIELARTGLNELRGTGNLGQAGAYLVSVRVASEDQELYSDAVGTVRTYSPEYQPGVSNQELLKEASAAAGGKLGITPADAFRADIPLGRRRIDVSRWLILASLLLFPLDIALRRLSVSKEDIKQWKLESKIPARATIEPLLRAKKRAAFRHAPRDRAKKDVSPATIAHPPPIPVPSEPQEKVKKEVVESTTAAELLRRKRRRRPN